MKKMVLCLNLLSVVFCDAQNVTTLPVKGLNGPNGFAIDSSGQLFIANEPGKQVVRLINDSTIEVILSCDSPGGLTFDDHGNLYVTNFFSGTVLKKGAHSVDTVAQGLDKPADIKCDGQGNLFVSEYEAGNIKRIDRAGKIAKVAWGLKFPFGLTFDDEGNLYIASNGSGEIYEFHKTGALTLFAQIPGAISYLAFSRRSGNLYATCLTCHNIYKVTKKGKVVLLIGTGSPGDKDGSFNEAQFNGPNSIEISKDGTLYVSEFSLNRIRKITGVEK